MEQEQPTKLVSSLLHTSPFERSARTGDDRFAYAVKRKLRANSLPKSEQGVTRTQISLMMNDMFGDEFDLSFRETEPYHRAKSGSLEQTLPQTYDTMPRCSSGSLTPDLNIAPEAVSTSVFESDPAATKQALAILIEQLAHTKGINDWVYRFGSNQRTFPFVQPDHLNDPEILQLYQIAQDLYSQCYPGKGMCGHDPLANPQEI